MENTNQNVNLEKQLLPINCEKPKFTIQDSYLMFYFGGINFPKGEEIAIINPSKIEHKAQLKSLQKEMIESTKETTVVNTDKHSFNLEKKIFSGKKTKRYDYSDSNDPLEIFNIRDKKGNFVKDEKKLLSGEGVEEEIDNEVKYNNTNITHISSSTYNNLSTSKNIHNHKKGDKYEDEDIVGIKKEAIEQDLLVPVSFRHKRKNK